MGLKVGFRVDRIGYYRLFGALIDAAGLDGAETHLLHRDIPADRVGPKAYQWADPSKVPVFQHARWQVHQWSTDTELYETARDLRLDAIVTIWSTWERAPMISLQRDGVTWVALQDALDFHAYPASALLAPDAVFVFSDYWIDLIERSYSAEVSPASVRAKVVATGWPELESYRTLDRRASRARLGVPADAPVVTLATYRPHRSDPWEQIVFRSPNVLVSAARALRKRRLDLLARRFREPTYSTLLRSLRRFCDRDQAILISKHRPKDEPPALERALADIAPTDFTHYPATIIDVAAISRIFIAFLSASTLEAVYGGAYCICPLPPDDSHWLNDAVVERTRRLARYRDEGSLWNFPGVVQQMPIREFVDLLRTATPRDFRLDARRRSAYVERFLGDENSSPATRSWERLREIVGTRARHRTAVTSL